jgi:hypothetical protein
VYAGKIKVPGDRKHPDRFVKGLHTPIITEADFWLAQEKLGNKRPSKVQPEEKFPLRGVLKCWCGLHMTAGYSKGKKQYYLYYRCIKHTSTNLSGNMLHDKFSELLTLLSFTVEQIEYIAFSVKTMLKTALKDKENQLAANTKQLELVNQKIEELEERFFNKDIELETYKRWFTKYSSERAHVLDEMNKSNKDGKGKWDKLQRILPSLTSLNALYERASIRDKHSLIKAVFKHAITFSEGAFRTPSISELFAHNYLAIREKGLLFVEQPCVFSGANPFCSP